MKELNLKVGPVYKNQKGAPKIYKDGLPGLWSQPEGNDNPKALIYGLRSNDFKRHHSFELKFNCEYQLDEFTVIISVPFCVECGHTQAKKGHKRFDIRRISNKNTCTNAK